ncbi:MAG: phosphatidylserine/phosphatidylglycerophosphate/cardiolipin synthase family protein, partial [Gammaproteobacteria bacterium]
ATVRDGNRFALLSDGREFFSRILAAVDDSRDYVLVEFYLVASGRVMDDFIAAFTRATRRGVRVRALFDAFGARGLIEADRARLRAAQVEVVYFGAIRWRTFPRFFLRNHRKLLIVDGVVGFTGGTGLADMFSPAARPDDSWLDCVVDIAGPVLKDWHRLFAGTWQRSAHRQLDVAMRPALAQYPGERGRVAVSRGLGTHELERSVITKVRAARKRVWIATAYFWPSNRLRRSLRRAARRGVDVRLLLPGPHTDAPAARGVGRLFYVRLLASGVVIYEYQPSFLHAKVVLCDDWASVGSSNLDRWGVLWNLDANQEIESPMFARQVEAMLNQTCERSAILRNASDVRHHWSVAFWQWIAKAVLAWSVSAASRLRRGPQ